MGAKAGTRKAVLVVAGIVRDPQGFVLVARRSAGRHLAGFWEFPGGKVEPGEDPRIALARELEEELGLVVEVGDPIGTHAYTDDVIDIELTAYEILSWMGHPTLVDHDGLQWLPVSRLHEVELTPADLPVAADLRMRDIPPALRC